EIERLISDPLIPSERRLLYALKAIAGLRHGEAAALRWRAYDATVEPLGKLTVAFAFSTPAKRIKSTKTGEVRYVPVHPTLAKLLAAWKLAGWERTYGRTPGLDDLIVPGADLEPMPVGDAGAAMKEDLQALGLRLKAGDVRDRGGHDLRGFFISQAIEDGADSLLIRR